jgi:tartrate dehydratase beta subunit/fumarate hydratase class I family protein
MIGKGRRSPEVKASMLEHGCVYFGAVEGHAALLAMHCSRRGLCLRRLGPEAIRRLEVVDVPAVVVNDLHGHDLYEEAPLQMAPFKSITFGSIGTARALFVGRRSRTATPTDAV